MKINLIERQEWINDKILKDSVVEGQIEKEETHAPSNTGTFLGDEPSIVFGNQLDFNEILSDLTSENQFDIKST